MNPRSWACQAQGDNIIVMEIFFDWLIFWVKNAVTGGKENKKF